ncbi:MAG TPA: phosphonate metabolism transcriptional regulator PhnF [Alphaproteobacteria bacterium]|jgi:GntR family phosphonate transport system transcriptional regulator|nr:phosphonate metabolism transcriptional regulator PhnF [Alphaproteobacteria bacterium]
MTQTLSRRPGQTLWAQIAETLSEDIALGGYRPGERLPAEQQLAERFGVNRHTVRRALLTLEQEGVVRTERGRGTFVEEDVVKVSLAHRTRFSESVGGTGAARRHELLRAYETPAREAAAKALGLRLGAPLLCLEALGSVNGRLVSLGHHFFDAGRFRGLDAAFRKTPSITRCLAAYGVADYLRRQTAITAMLPSPEQARLLKQPRTRPVLRTEWSNVEQDGRPVEYGITWFAADRVQLMVTPPA